jgi:hypothetical protein
MEEPCGMKVIVYLSVVDDYYYLSMASNMTHNGHFELTNTCIPLNESHLNNNDKSMIDGMFNSHIPASTISRVLLTMKGKHDTHLDKKLLYNMRAKAQNLIDSSLGYTADMNDADKTLLKLQE